MQCLGQTPYLVHLLEETSTAGQNFRLPGGKLTLDDKDTVELEQLEGIPSLYDDLNLQHS